jgi:hypothetical protein
MHMRSLHLAATLRSADSCSDVTWESNYIQVKVRAKKKEVKPEKSNLGGGGGDGSCEVK